MSSFLEVGDTGREFIVRVDELPDDISRVRALLDNEQAPIDVWIDVASAYVANGKPQLCEALLNKLVEMSEADLQALMYTEPAAASEQRDMLKFAQIQAYCFMAQMKLDEAALTNADAAKRGLVNSAQGFLQRAEEIDRDEGMIVLMRGQVQIVQENYQAARMTFQRAKPMKFNRTKSSVAPHLANAQLYLLQRDFRAALKEYTDALTHAHHTEGSNAIRIGIGICHMSLGDLNLARLAFERVASVDDTSAEALTGLAAVELLAPEGTMERFLELLAEAYRLDPHSSPLNTALAQFNLVRGDLLAADAYAQVAVSTANDKCTRAQALCVLARTMQARGRHSQALSLYQESMEARELPLAVYGYAQMLIGQHQEVNAATELEKVLKALASDRDALLLTGKLLPQVTTGIPSQQRLALLKDGAMHHILNPAIQEVLGEVLAVAEPDKSVKAFQKALELQREAFDAGTGPRPSARLLNNTGVLEYRSKHFSEALPLLQSALDQLQQNGEDGPLWQQSVVILRFNIARCHEAQGAIQSAQAGYEDILREHPDFVDCWLRLGYMHAARGKRAEADAHFMRCTELEDGKQEAWTAMCMSHVRYNDWNKAKEHAKKLLSCATTDESKSFAHVLHGNVYFASAPPKSKDSRQEEKRFGHLSSAARHYIIALNLQKGNIYAANGLGAVAGSLGQLDAARTILSQLRESAGLTAGFVEVPDVWVNLGSLHLARGEPHDAARMYTAALTRFYRNKDPKVSVWLARAYYDADDDKSCKRSLLKAIHSFPDDQALYFNLALTMQHSAGNVLSRPAKKDGQPGSTRAELEGAAVALVQASGLFSRLSHLPKAHLTARGLKKEHINSHIKHCEKLSLRATALIDKVKAADEIRQRQVEEQEQRTQIMREAAEVQRRMQAETERSRAAEQQATLAEQQKLLKIRNTQWINEKATKDAAKKGDSSKAAKLRQKQQEEEEQQRAQMEYDGQIAAVMGMGGSSSDEEYDADAMAMDAAEAEAEERHARDAGYNSNDEKGTADVHMHDDEPRKEKKKKSGKKRRRRGAQAALEDPPPGLDDLVDPDADPTADAPGAEADGLGDDGLGDDLDLEGEDGGLPPEKKRAVLESDDE